MENPSCLLYGPCDARFENCPMPVIEDAHDVIIRIAYVGICGSDVHFWLQGGMKNHVSTTDPLVMGHKASGIVHAIGPAVTNLKPGDEIAIEPGYACHICTQCKSGNYNLCPHMKFAADPPHTHGTLSKFFKIPADCCCRISGTVDDEPRLRGRTALDEAVLIEPLAVAVHSVRQAAEQVATELRKEVEESAPDSGVAGFDVAIEATGGELCIRAAVHSLRAGGSFVQVGLGHRSVNFPISTVLENEITVKGCFRYGVGDFKLALEMVLSGKIELKSLITKIVPFEDAVEAGETTKRGERIKTLIRVGL